MLSLKAGSWMNRHCEVSKLLFSFQWVIFRHADNVYLLDISQIIILANQESSILNNIDAIVFGLIV